jgi:hypothetical protein
MYCNVLTNVKNKVNFEKNSLSMPFNCCNYEKQRILLTRLFQIPQKLLITLDFEGAIGMPQKRLVKL